MDRLDGRVPRGRQKPVDVVRAGDRLGLGASVAIELGPASGGFRRERLLIVAGGAGMAPLKRVARGGKRQIVNLLGGATVRAAGGRPIGSAGGGNYDRCPA